MGIFGEVEKYGHLHKRNGEIFLQWWRGFPSQPVDENTGQNLQTTLNHQMWPRADLLDTGGGCHGLTQDIGEDTGVEPMTVVEVVYL